MPASIKLFVSCHKPGIRVPDNRLILPLQVGAARSAKRLAGMLHDDDGENISRKNQSYCELTGQYWAWKNAMADYFGFLHYRRYFNFSAVEYPIHHEPFIFGDVVFDSNDEATLDSIGFSEEQMRDCICSHDFIAPEPIATPDGFKVYNQYRLSAGHHIEDFDFVLDVIRCQYPEIWPSAEKYLNQDRLYVCNMFVMRRDMFEDYSQFLFDILAQHDRFCDVSHYTSVARRVDGYLGERLCGIYLTYLYDQGYVGCNLQRVYFRDVAIGPATAPSSSIGPGAPSRGIHFGKLSRGTGKIYIALDIPPELVSTEAESLRSVSVRSFVPDGVAVPAKIVLYNGTFVLILQVLDVDQTVTVDVRDEFGALVASSSRRISRQVSALRSKGNTLLRDRGALAIRNCDKLPLANDTRLRIDRCIVDVDGTNILQGKITIPLDSREGADDFLEVVTIDSHGRRINMGDWCCLRDEVHEDVDFPSSWTRVVEFSIRIPDVRRYSVWAQFPESCAQDCFMSVISAAAASMRRDWRLVTTPASEDPGYDLWFRERHRASAQELNQQKNVHFGTKPVFSIVVPLFRTPIPFLQEMAKSVLAQTYPGWQLVLVNASPQDAALCEAVHKLAMLHERITVVSLTKNKGITENTNEGIRVSTGDFICFLDHDDLLEPDALFWYARALLEHPDIDLFYCDEDKLDGKTYRQPFFKSKWNPDLLLGMNYVCHFLAVRTTLLDRIGLPTSDYDGSQDWHMTFRIGEQARRIHHEPRVLYHWRVHKNSTASSAGQKDYTLDSSRLSVATHLERCNIAGEVVDSPIMGRRFAVKYNLADKPLVSIVIPNKDAVKVLCRCITSIRRHSTYENYEIVIVENNSSDPDTFAYYQQMQAADPRIKVVTLDGLESFNFSRIVNYGVEHSSGDYVLLLNNDTEVITPDWIQWLLGTSSRRDVGAVGARLLFPDGTTQHAGVTICEEGPCHLGYLLPRNATGNMESMQNTRDVAAVTGACLMTKRGVYERLHGMNEEFAVNYNDIDYCLRVLGEGLHVVYCPLAELYHYESVSRGEERTGEKALRFRAEKGMFMQLWPTIFEKGDPYGNPNLEPGNIYERLNWSKRVKGEE